MVIAGIWVTVDDGTGHVRVIAKGSHLTGRNGIIGTMSVAFFRNIRIDLYFQWHDVRCRHSGMDS